MFLYLNVCKFRHNYVTHALFNDCSGEFEGTDANTINFIELHFYLFSLFLFKLEIAQKINIPRG